MFFKLNEKIEMAQTAASAEITRCSKYRDKSTSEHYYIPHNVCFHQ